MNNPKISALVLAKNEAARLGRCLKSLEWVEKIVLVDDCSTDETVKIAKQYGAEVFRRKLDDFSSQRNFGLKKIKTKWVILIDADEEVPPALKEEVLAAIGSDKYDGYFFPRANILFGKQMKNTGWYPDYRLYLFQTRKGSFRGKVHEKTVLKGKAGYLENSLIHHNFQTISQYLQKLDLYTTLEAKTRFKDGAKPGPARFLRIPAGEFFKRFFVDKGYLDGLHGFVLSLLQAFSELAVEAKIWELSGFPATDISMKQLDEEAAKLKKELVYWRANAGLEIMKKNSSRLALIRKLKLKAKRKLSS